MYIYSLVYMYIYIHVPTYVHNLYRFVHVYTCIICTCALVWAFLPICHTITSSTVSTVICIYTYTCIYTITCMFTHSTYIYCTHTTHYSKSRGLSKHITIFLITLVQSTLLKNIHVLKYIHKWMYIRTCIYISIHIIQVSIIHASP